MSAPRPTVVFSLLSAVWISACTSEAPDYAAQLRQADLDFAAATAARGNDGWADYFLAGGVMFPPSGKIEGREAIREAMADAFRPDTRLDWEPTTAVAAASGALGYTMGRWSSVVVKADGSDSVTARGHYVTIWRRDDEGRWRVAVDIGNTDTGPEPELSASP